MYSYNRALIKQKILNRECMADTAYTECQRYTPEDLSKQVSETYNKLSGCSQNLTRRYSRHTKERRI